MNNKKVKYKLRFQFPKNNFLIGLGSVLNIGGLYFENNYAKSGRLSDLKALSSDWENIGKDFKESKEIFENENEEELCLNY